MGAPAKFLFDVDFAAPAKDPNAAKEQVPTAEEIAKRVADAEARSYRAGFDAAQREAKVSSDRKMAQALAGIESSVATIAKNFATVENRMETEAVEVALAVARKLCTELMAAEPLTEI